eukprot:COSAG06_NODE_549_length_14405_cov_6.391933_7_plen_263_part_00
MLCHTAAAAAAAAAAVVQVDVQFPWESVATPHHKHIMSISKFYIDKTPVTRAQYSQYLNESGYMPDDTHNFLRNWTKITLPSTLSSSSSSSGSSGGGGGSSGGGSSYQENQKERQQRVVYRYHPSDGEKPVVHVSLTEARLYCAHYGKRLPHTWEWSYAAQGTDGREYPWGNDTAKGKSAVDGTHCPLLQQHTQGDQEGLANVTAYAPQGASPFGVLDLVGNVWQFTDEFQVRTVPKQAGREAGERTTASAARAVPCRAVLY